LNTISYSGIRFRPYLNCQNTDVPPLRYTGIIRLCYHVTNKWELETWSSQRVWLELCANHTSIKFLISHGSLRPVVGCTTAERGKTNRLHAYIYYWTKPSQENNLFLIYCWSSFSSSCLSYRWPHRPAPAPSPPFCWQCVVRPALFLHR
jgi:hypothetical protein